MVQMFFFTRENNPAYGNVYTNVQVDLCSFADGGPHLLRIEGSTLERMAASRRQQYLGVAGPTSWFGALRKRAAAWPPPPDAGNKSCEGRSG